MEQYLREPYEFAPWDEGYLVARDLLHPGLEYVIATSEADPGTPFLFVQENHPYLIADNHGLIWPHELARLNMDGRELGYINGPLWGKLGTQIYREVARQVSFADTGFLPRELVELLQDADTPQGIVLPEKSLETPRFAVGFKLPQGRPITAKVVLQEYQKHCARAVIEGRSNHLHDILVENWEAVVVQTVIAQFGDKRMGFSLPERILQFKQLVSHDYAVKLPKLMDRHLLIYKPKRTMSAEMKYCENEAKRGELAVKFLDGVGRGLYKLHLLGMAFRDLKLGNTLVDEGRVELTDFDSVASLWLGELPAELVPLVIASDDERELCVVAGKSVTTSHAAPEQLEFPKGLELDPEANIEVQQRGDIYSLGICLWQILAKPSERSKPFIDPSSGERLSNEERVDRELADARLAVIVGDDSPAFVNVAHELKKMTAYASGERPELLLAIIDCFKALAADGVDSAVEYVGYWERVIADL